MRGSSLSPLAPRPQAHADEATAYVHRRVTLIADR
jgi:hypothetical protein